MDTDIAQATLVSTDDTDGDSVVAASLANRETVAERASSGHVHDAAALHYCRLQDGTTGRHDDFGNTFSERFTDGVGRGHRYVNVQLRGWDLNYARKDHNIDRVAVQISKVDYDQRSGKVRFVVSGAYHDRNRDDDFTWEVFYTVLALG